MQLLRHCGGTQGTDMAKESHSSHETAIKGKSEGAETLPPASYLLRAPKHP